MSKDGYMTGCQLRQYLHISTRKLKYFMDNDIIPHENTGQSTHKYLVKKEDAEAFTERMLSDSLFLCELKGQFTSRKEWHPLILLEATSENSEAFGKYLTEAWSTYPDALPIKTAAELIGSPAQSIRELIKKDILHSVKIGSVAYLSKEQFIGYASSIEKIANPTGTAYKDLIRAFKYKRMRENENEQRRIKRSEAKEQ